ncbi:MAG: nuclear transport factor 2 family protein [Oscillospiraceae bacterium]|nr:nuclear transport factor 2 family protein [Oscillospiraceae bacterium]
MDLEQLEAQVSRLEAEIEIKNSMGYYSFHHVANMQRETIALFAPENEGVRSTMMWGAYNGQEGVYENFMVRHMDYHEPNRCLGVILYHVMTSGVIEVAGDGQTARATWLSPGMSIWPDVNRGVVPTDKDVATVDWANIKYGMDYVKQDGVWYWYHQRVYSIFGAPYNECWVDCPAVKHDWQPSSPEEMALYPQSPRHGVADREADGWWGYAPGCIYPDDYPPLPVPYENFEKDVGYGY